MSRSSCELWASTSSRHDVHTDAWTCRRRSNARDCLGTRLTLVPAPVKHRGTKGTSPCPSRREGAHVATQLPLPLNQCRSRATWMSVQHHRSCSRSSDHSSDNMSDCGLGTIGHYSLIAWFSSPHAVSREGVVSRGRLRRKSQLSSPVVQVQPKMLLTLASSSTPCRARSATRP